MRNNRIIYKKAISVTFGVFIGYLFLGIAFGLLFSKNGYGFIHTTLMSIFLYSGAMSLISADLLLLPFNPINVLLITFIINSRYMLYSFGLLKKYDIYGYEKFYMIHTITDESYALQTGILVPEFLNKKKFGFLINLLPHLYWIFGTFCGTILANLISFELKGIEFSMTALFVTVVVDQIRIKKMRKIILMGFVVSVTCLLLLKSLFLIPAMACITGILLIFKNKLGGTNDLNSTK